MEGIIVSFDAADGLGWIELSDQRRIRFGLGGCKGVPPAPGRKVVVAELKEVRGTLRAVAFETFLDEWDEVQTVWPEVVEEFVIERRWQEDAYRQVRVRRVKLDRNALVRETPDWLPPTALAELAELVTQPHRPDTWPRPSADGPELFAPWHARIVAASSPVVRLTPTKDATAAVARIGGNQAAMTRSWPSCPHGHGEMKLLFTAAAPAFADLDAAPAQLSIHACTRCFGIMHADRVWLGEPDAVARVSVAPPEAPTWNTTSGAIEPRYLRRQLAHQVPPSWIFRPRRDVSGHVPVTGGAAAALLDVQVLRDPPPVQEPYEPAWFVFDRHYQGEGTVTLGGFADHAFASCPVCARPLRQRVGISDFLPGIPIYDALGGRTLNLLACDRTPACGGPERGLLAVTA